MKTKIDLPYLESDPMMDELIERLRINFKEDIQSILACSSQPYQTAISQMSEEIRSLVQLLKIHDENALLCENIRLKLELKHKNYQLMEFEKRLQPKRSFFKNIFN